MREASTGAEMIAAVGIFLLGLRWILEPPVGLPPPGILSRIIYFRFPTQQLISLMIVGVFHLPLFGTRMTAPLTWFGLRKFCTFVEFLAFAILTIDIYERQQSVSTVFFGVLCALLLVALARVRYPA